MRPSLSTKKTRLPSWFKLSKYKDMEKLTLLGWYKHLWVRQHCAGVIGRYRNFWLDLNPAIPEHAAHVIKALRLNPLGADKTVDDVMKSQLDSFSPQNLRATSSGIHSLTMSELCEQVFTLTEEKRTVLCCYVNLPSAGQLALYTKNKDWMSQAIDVHQSNGWWNKHLLAINLDLSQDLLVSQFREWLSEKRGEREKRGEVVPYAYNTKEWTNMGLLPCIDLLMWADAEGIRLSNRFITRAIHDEGLARESATARTTIPCARDFLSHGNKSLMQLVRLRADAAAELADIQRADIRRDHHSKNRN